MEIILQDEQSPTLIADVGVGGKGVPRIEYKKHFYKRKEWPNAISHRRQSLVF